MKQGSEEKKKGIRKSHLEIDLRRIERIKKPLLEEVEKLNLKIESIKKELMDLDGVTAIPITFF